MTLPPTTSLKPRPVWARFLRRVEEGEPLSPPTEAERYDAIQILHHAYVGPCADSWLIAGSPEGQMVKEAERIFHEASL